MNTDYSLRVLVVEDEEYRKEWFRGQYPFALIVAHPDDAIAALVQQAWDVLYLDHDLGLEPRNGRDVANWLIKERHAQPGIRIVVHSVNVVSGPKIERELQEGGRRAEWRPFYTLTEQAVLP